MTSMKKFQLALALLAGVVAAPALAGTPDCPLADAPYSSRSPMADILLDPDARATIERIAPAAMGPITGAAGFKFPDGFARIVTPAWLLKLVPGNAGKLAPLNAALARIPVTPAARIARCARYDDTPPILPAMIRRPAILVFDKINGFRDAASVDAAGAALRAMAARRGWTLVESDNGAVFNPANLGRFDAVVWNNVSGDALTLSQRAAFKAWIEAGGGFAGIHGSGGDPVWFWDWYVDDLIGARFTGHPMQPQFQAAKVRIDDPGSAITRGLAPGWTMTEEWYSFAASPRSTGAHILATLDEASYHPTGFGGEDLRMGDHPIAWTRCLGDGRAFYTAIGHRPESYAEPHSALLLERGIEWAMGLGETRCASGLQSSRGSAR